MITSPPLDSIRQELIEGFERFAAQSKDENNQPRPLAPAQKLQLEKLVTRALAKAAEMDVSDLDQMPAEKIQEIKQQALAALSARIDKNSSPLRFLVNVIRDGEQSDFAGKTPLVEFAPILPLHNALPFAQLENSGGRYGLEAQMNQGHLPFSYMKKGNDQVPDQENVCLTRASVACGFGKYPPEIQNLFYAQLKQAGVKRVRMFSSPNAADDILIPIRLLKKQGFNVQAEVSFGTSDDPAIFTMDKDVAYAQRMVDAGADAIGCKDFSGTQPGKSEKDSDRGADIWFRTMREHLPDYVQLTQHNHQVVGRGVDSTVEAIKAGLEAGKVNPSTVCIAPSSTYSQPPLDKVLERLAQEPRVGKLSESETALLDIISLYYTHFHAKRYEAYKGKDVDPSLFPAILETQTPGGGLAAARVELEKLSQNSGVKLSAEELEALYLKTLKLYRKATGEYPQVTPFYAYTDEMAQKNSKKALGNNGFSLDDLSDWNKIFIPDPVKNSLRGLNDASPGPMESALVERVLREDLEQVAKECNVAITQEQVAALRSVGDAINEEISRTRAIKDAKEWVVDVRNRLQDIEVGEIPAEAGKYFERRLALAQDALEKANKTQAEHPLDITYDDYVLLKTGALPEEKIRALRERLAKDAPGLQTFDDATFGKLLSKAMQNKANPVDLLKSNLETAKNALVWLKTKFNPISIEDDGQALAMLAMGKVLPKNGGAHSGFMDNQNAKLFPIAFLEARHEARMLLQKQESALRRQYNNTLPLEVEATLRDEDVVADITVQRMRNKTAEVALPECLRLEQPSKPKRPKPDPVVVINQHRQNEPTNWTAAYRSDQNLGWDRS